MCRCRSLWDEHPFSMKNSRLLLPRRILQNALFPSTILKRVIFHEGNIIVLTCPVTQIIYMNFGSWNLSATNAINRGKAMRQAFAKLLRHSPGKSDSRVKAARWKEIKALVALLTPPPPFNVVPCYFDWHVEIHTTLIRGEGGCEGIPSELVKQERKSMEFLKVFATACS